MYAWQLVMLILDPPDGVAGGTRFWAILADADEMVGAVNVAVLARMTVIPAVYGDLVDCNDGFAVFYEFRVPDGVSLAREVWLVHPCGSSAAAAVFVVGSVICADEIEKAVAIPYQSSRYFQSRCFEKSWER
jgi:hypothetical protein